MSEAHPRGGVHTGFWSTWRTSLRVSRREAWRAKGRSALVIAMIALPVVGLALFAATYDMFRLTPAEQATRDMGRATAWVAWQVNGPIEQPQPTEFDLSFQTLQDNQTGPATHTTADVLAALPPGSRAIEYVRPGGLGMRTATGTGTLSAIGLDVADPLTRGLVTLVRGRAPHGPGEVALSEPALSRLGARIGGQIAEAGGGRTYTVVGVVEVPSKLRELMVFTPDALSAIGVSTGIYGSGAPPVTWLVETPSPVSLDEVHRFNAIGMQVVSRAVRLDPPPMPRPVQDQARTLSLAGVVGGVALLEIILLAGPAFAVGARRRQHDLALVAANGGTPAHLRRLVLADGVLLGLLAGALGVLVGAAGAVAGRPLVEAHMMHARAGGYRFYPTALLAITGLAVLTGVLAALVPAFTAARQDVVVTLAGRRGAVRSRKRWLVAGIVLCGLGTLLAAYGAAQASANLIVSGLAAGELGLALCTPSLVGLVSRAGRLLPAAPRIALRDTARNRASAAPAISAVMAAVAASVVIGVFLQSSHERDADSHWQTLPTGYAMVTGGSEHSLDTKSIDRVLRATLPVRQTAVLQQVACPPALAGPSYLCDIELALPAEHACPYQPYGEQPLSKAQQRTAARDPRCSGDNWQDRNLLAPAVMDGAGAVTTLTGAQPDDAAAAVAVLGAGGVVVPDAKYLVNGEATVTARFLTAEQDAGAPSAKPSPTPPPAGASPTSPPAGASPVPQAAGASPANPTPAPAPSSSNSTPAPSNPTPTPAGATEASPADATQAPARPPITLSVPGYVLTSSVNTTRQQWIVSPALLGKLGLAANPVGMAAATTRMPTQAEQDKLNAATNALPDGYHVDVERGPSRSAGPTAFILALVAGVIALGAAGIATGLAAADGRADLATLAAVGAAPRVRRLLSLSQSGVIAGLGSLLGGIAGLGSGFAVLIALNRPWANVWPSQDQLPLVVPWLSLGIGLLAVPAAAMLSAGMLTRSRLPIEARRPT